jgi:hypothetical protein
MAKANIKANFRNDIAKVWNVVTDLNHYAWRSDLSKIEVLEAGKKFVEYTKGGYPTTFTVTYFEPLKRYEFDLENGNLNGHWIGIFEKTPEGTGIDFTEVVEVKKPIFKLLAGIYLRKHQRQYIADLRKVLGE